MKCWTCSSDSKRAQKQFCAEKFDEKNIDNRDRDLSYKECIPVPNETTYCRKLTKIGKKLHCASFLLIDQLIKLFYWLFCFLQWRMLQFIHGHAIQSRPMRQRRNVSIKHPYLLLWKINIVNFVISMDATMQPIMVQPHCFSLFQWLLQDFSYSDYLSVHFDRLVLIFMLWISFDFTIVYRKSTIVFTTALLSDTRFQLGFSSTSFRISKFHIVYKTFR